SPGEGAPSVMPVYLRLQNPLELGALLPQDEAQSRALTEAAKAAGHDGIIVRGADGTLDEIVVFDPTQIKSVFNRGTWDANDPNMLQQGRRGAYDPATRTIALLQAADLSTFLHESAHHYLEVLIATADDSPVVAADLRAIFEYLGTT